MTQPQDPRNSVETSGGVHVEGDVNIQQGDFVGRYLQESAQAF